MQVERSHHFHGELSSGLARDEQTGPPTCLRQHRGVDTMTPRSTCPTVSDDSDQPAMPISNSWDTGPHPHKVGEGALFLAGPTHMVSPVVMYGCESWTVKKAERRRIDAFELWCWKRLLRVPWTARRSNILGVHWKDWCWSWNSNTLATSREELTHWKRLWCWEGLGAGGEGDDRGWDGWMASPTRWIWVWVNSRSWWWTGRPVHAIHGVAKSRTRLSDWTELKHVWGGKGCF